jgi:hypothetical protein
MLTRGWLIGWADRTLRQQDYAAEAEALCPAVFHELSAEFQQFAPLALS